MKNPIIFLDFDGVVNTIFYRYYPREDKYHFRYAHEEDGFVNNTQAIAWLNELYLKYPFDIVVTSTWRRFSDYRAILMKSGLDLRINILGATPWLENETRGAEIIKWIDDNHCRDRNIIILDDDTDMEGLNKDLIKCDPYLGFTIYEYMECLKRMKEFEKYSY